MYGIRRAFSKPAPESVALHSSAKKSEIIEKLEDFENKATASASERAPFSEQYKSLDAIKRDVDQVRKDAHGSLISRPSIEETQDKREVRNAYARAHAIIEKQTKALISEKLPPAVNTFDKATVVELKQQSELVHRLALTPTAVSVSRLRTSTKPVGESELKAADKHFNKFEEFNRAYMGALHTGSPDLPKKLGISELKNFLSEAPPRDANQVAQRGEALAPLHAAAAHIKVMQEARNAVNAHAMLIELNGKGDPTAANRLIKRLQVSEGLLSPDFKHVPYAQSLADELRRLESKRTNHADGEGKFWEDQGISADAQVQSIQERQHSFDNPSYGRLDSESDAG